MVIIEKKIPFLHSIRCKMLFTMISLIVSLLLILTFIQISAQKQTLQKDLNTRIELMRNSLKEKAELQAENLHLQVEEALATFNLYNLVSYVKKIVADNEDLSYIILMDIKGKAPLHTMEPELQGTILNQPEDKFAIAQTRETTNEYVKNGVTYLEVIFPTIHVGNRQWGFLRLGYSLENLNNIIKNFQLEIKKQISKMAMRSFLILVVFVIIGFILVVFISSRISNPLIRLTSFAQELAKGNFLVVESLEIPERGEVAILGHTFKEMSKNLEASYHKLAEYSRTLEDKVQERTMELQNTLDELSRSQDRLIQSEKMASLGQLVAGVAHEINTPVGIGVASASHLVDMTNKISQAIENKTAKKDDLFNYFTHAAKTSELILTHLNRTSELIKSFKMVSADQTSLEKRMFRLKNYFEDIILSLYPQIKKGSHKVEVLCPEDFEIDSYPGAFAQIITNLIMNSLTHGYEKGQSGSIFINIDVPAESEEFIIKFTDDGKGIGEDDLKKIFDPFFTTKRGDGGTGLGLNIVFNIITQTLQGSIICESKEGKGASFIINLPFIV